MTDENQPEATTTKSFTGVRRERKTTWTIKLKDLLAQWIITLGGIGTILAVMTVGLFLVYVVSPLFWPGPSSAKDDLKVALPVVENAPLSMEMDEHLTLTTVLDAQGQLDVIQMYSGEKVASNQIFPTDKTVSAFGITNNVVIAGETFPYNGSRIFALGYEDGSVQFGYLRFKTEFRRPTEIPVDVRNKLKDYKAARNEAGGSSKARPFTVAYDKGIVERTPKGQYRYKEAEAGLFGSPISAFDGPIQKISITFATGRPRIVVYAKPKGAEKEEVMLVQGSLSVNRMTGRLRARLNKPMILKDITEDAQDLGKPDWMFATGSGLHVLLAWKDGMVHRYRTSVNADQVTDPKFTYLAEKFRVVKTGREATMMAMMVGGNTMIVGDDQGSVTGWFVTPPLDITVFDYRLKEVQKDDGTKGVQNLIWAFGHMTLGDLNLKNDTYPDAQVIKKDFIYGQNFASDNEELLEKLKAYTTDIDGENMRSVGADALIMQKTKNLQSDLGTAATTMSISRQTRLLGVGFEDGSIRMYQVTADIAFPRAFGETANGKSVEKLSIAPKDDYILASSGNELSGQTFDRQYHEATLTAMFLPIWYEDGEEPTIAYQSSPGDNESEHAIGFWVLIFGSLKATFYALLFGAPIALLAALFTSEFLHPKVKMRVKPIIELMASLPSVVLGFLAALVFAQSVEGVLPQVLAMFLTVPLTFMTLAYLWQMLPYPIQIRLREFRFPMMLILGIPIGGVTALGLGNLSLGFDQIGPLNVGAVNTFFRNMLGGSMVGNLLLEGMGGVLEGIIAGGDIKDWLSRKTNTEIFNINLGGMGAWLIILFPLSIIVTLSVIGAFVNPVVRGITLNMNRQMVAIVEFFKFLVTAALTVIVALVLAGGFQIIGWDPRGTVIDSYIQRNALIVGIVMGFAIIPIIYTIAEDALSTVPEHLRSASLGAGATPWQTAVRIVIPVAMSGLFSAMMIGLGRAVGETMIMLMATGNTAIWEVNMWNIFNGFRTLAANIATELPEAPKGEWHYRILFLNALVLFAMTLVINTIAEFIRQRFRKRSGGL